MPLEYHPLANLFPLIEGEEFDALVADIRANGIHDAIDLYQGKILDGRNRYRAAEAAGFDLEKRHFRHFMPELYGDPLAYVISKNLNRRHLDDRQRASIAGKIANFQQGGDRSKPPIGGLTAAQAAEKLNVAPRQVERARTVHERGVAEVRDALDRGHIAVSEAERIARLSEDEQVEIIRRRLPNGARAIMGSRLEPADSLDYFPTPPWATRALCEHVLPRFINSRSATAWEPAAGEGHMAEPLREYFKEVYATDIHDYGYGDGGVNFLNPGLSDYVADFIITNPPFGDLTEAFVLRALKVARVGVAMFVRLQWLESVGRYETIFRDHPPSLIAFFAERVPLCKGRYDPEGSTATAYIWLVWRKGFQPSPPMWIPPGQCKALTLPDDAERFTQHPVAPKQHVYCDEPFDVETGEIPLTQPVPAAPEPVSESDLAQAPDAGSPIIENETTPPPETVASSEPAPEDAPSPAGAGSSFNDEHLEIPPFLKRQAEVAA
jgi:hypothetical protein